MGVNKYSSDNRNKVGLLHRSPFSGQLDYCRRKSELLALSLEMATCAQRDRFAEKPVKELRLNSAKMAALSDSIVRDIQDPLLLQPASLELVTLKKRSSDDLVNNLLYLFSMAVLISI